jgi:triacylglycerol lipase
MISDKSFLEKSLLFAKLSELAYSDGKTVKKEAKKLGFTTIEFYNKDGAQAYRLMNKEDLVIACRGTQPTEFNDIKADLQALPVIAETVSRVHRGFKAEVDELWPMVLEDLERKANDKKKIWFCGHSLGAAMATIMASRCHLYEGIEPVQELYTYGSPRVGWKKYCNSLGVVHHRWVNNNDIVTRVPLNIMGYVHDGQEHYINAYGKLRQPTGWQRVKDRFRGMWMGLKKGKIDNFTDHNIGDYIKHIEGEINAKKKS